MLCILRLKIGCFDRMKQVGCEVCDVVILKIIRKESKA